MNFVFTKTGFRIRSTKLDPFKNYAKPYNGSTIPSYVYYTSFVRWIYNESMGLYERISSFILFFMKIIFSDKTGFQQFCISSTVFCPLFQRQKWAWLVVSTYYVLLKTRKHFSEQQSWTFLTNFSRFVSLLLSFIFLPFPLPFFVARIFVQFVCVVSLRVWLTLSLSNILTISKLFTSNRVYGVCRVWRSRHSSPLSHYFSISGLRVILFYLWYYIINICVLIHFHITPLKYRYFSGLCELFSCIDGILRHFSQSKQPPFNARLSK